MPQAQFSTTTHRQSGDYVAVAQLAEVAGGGVVTGVPSDGLLVYFVNLNIRAGVEDLDALAKRNGPTAFIVGVLHGWEELERWREYFRRLASIGIAFFVYHPEQVDYLARYGIEACLIPCNEEGWTSAVAPEPMSVVYTGFYWDEKDLPMFVRVAKLLPEFRFTVHVGMNVNHDPNSFPPNVAFDGRFLETGEYRDLIGRHEIVWIPRHPSKWIYAGRSGITAVASRRTAILTAVGPNAVIPADACVKYPHEWTAEQVASLIRSRPRVEAEAVDRFLASVSPRVVWDRMQEVLRTRA